MFLRFILYKDYLKSELGKCGIQNAIVRLKFHAR